MLNPTLFMTVVWNGCLNSFLNFFITSLNLSLEAKNLNTADSSVSQYEPVLHLLLPKHLSNDTCSMIALILIGTLVHQFL